VTSEDGSTRPSVRSARRIRRTAVASQATQSGHPGESAADRATAASDRRNPVVGAARWAERRRSQALSRRNRHPLRDTPRRAEGKGASRGADGRDALSSPGHDPPPRSELEWHRPPGPAGRSVGRELPDFAHADADSPWRTNSTSRRSQNPGIEVPGVKVRITGGSDHRESGARSGPNPGGRVRLTGGRERGV